MKKIIIISVLFLSSCSLNMFDIQTWYYGTVANRTEDKLIVEFKSDTKSIEQITIYPLTEEGSHAVMVFSYDIDKGNQPVFDSSEFRNQIPLLNIYRIKDNDTVLLNTDSDFYKNINLWEYIYSWDDETDMHEYHLNIF